MQKPWKRPGMGSGHEANPAVGPGHLDMGSGRKANPAGDQTTVEGRGYYFEGKRATTAGCVIVLAADFEEEFSYITREWDSEMEATR